MKQMLAVAIALVLVPVFATGLFAQPDRGTDACPATIPRAGFDDTAHLPSPTQAAIDCIAHYGITAGTTSTTFSPAAPVSRHQMARFLVRTASALEVELPDGEASPFEDVLAMDRDGRRSISRLWQLGIAQGTGPGVFSPDRPVARRHMVLFLARSLRVAKVTPSADRPIRPFSDHAELRPEVIDDLRYLAALDIEWPGSPESFQPDRPVTREETAVLLAASLDAAGARHVRLQIELSASRAPTSSSVLATVTATKPDGKPYRGLLVDVFVATTGHRYDGTCLVDRDASVNGTDGGTSVDCHIDKADPRTDHRGQVRIGLAHSPIAERDRVYAWVGPLGQEYVEDRVRHQVWAELLWTGVPNRVAIETMVDQKFGTFVQIKARLLGDNVAGQRLIMLVLRNEVVAVIRVGSTAPNGLTYFGYHGPSDPSVNNDPELVEVIRVFWDRNGNGVHDGPAELFDEINATWDD